MVSTDEASRRGKSMGAATAEFLRVLQAVDGYTFGSVWLAEGHSVHGAPHFCRAGGR